mgnify:FL=1
MNIINQSNQHENWFEALALWNQIANWISYKTSERQLRQQFKTMAVYLWNEKDWLKGQYPEQSKFIENQINISKYMRVIGDLANFVKHRNISKHQRSEMRQTNYFGKVTLGCGASRRMYYIDLGNGEHEEVYQILRGALEEFSTLRQRLLSGAK